MIGDIIDKRTPISAYQPPKPVADLTADVKKDYSQGAEILNRSWNELNDYSVIDRMNKDQRTFNALVDESVENPAEAWKWRGTRSKARKKALAMHAHLTANYIVPMVSAQNDDDEEDRGMADIMRDILDWMIAPTNSNYQSSFLMASMGMLVNPVTYLGAEYCEVMQKVKTKTDNGYETKEVLDEVLSGFQAPVYSADQILITNAFEQNIQKQRRVIKRRYIEYAEARAKWEDHENWQYVQKGLKSVYNEEDGLFYDVKDDEHPNLVAEETVLGRREDLEVVYLNGIYMGETDVEANPIKFRDHQDRPKYNVVPFGYHRVNEHFFYYKSMMFELGWENQLYDAMSELVMNRALLEVEMPIAISGVDDIDSDVIFPGASIAMSDPQSKITPLLPAANFGAGFEALKETDDSMGESSVSEVQQGQLPAASQKAYSVAQAAHAAKVVLSGVGKTLGVSVAQYGSLMTDIAVNHVTVAQVVELGGGKTKLKYKAFLLNNKNVGGRQSNKRIVFDEALLGADMTEEEQNDASLALLDQVGYPNHKEHIYRVNPELFARMKYLVRVDPEEMYPKNKEYQQALDQNMYTLLRADPLIEPEALLRRLLYSNYGGEGEEMISKNTQMLPAIMNAAQQPAQSAAGARAEQKGLSTGLPRSPVAV